MHEFASRSAALALAVSGVATLVLGLGLAADGGLAVQQLRLLTTAVGAALLLAVGVPAWRLPVVAIALASKLTYLAACVVAGDLQGRAAAEALLLVLLAGAGAVFLREARREARWNGGQSLRLEP